MKGTQKPMRMGLSLRRLIAKARMRKEEERSTITDKYDSSEASYAKLTDSQKLP
jgi:hypothetical protein